MMIFMAAKISRAWCQGSDQARNRTKLQAKSTEDFLHLGGSNPDEELLKVFCYAIYVMILLLKGYLILSFQSLISYYKKISSRDE